ncbi:MAG TPA: hypothetical protein VKZ53_13845, partial [Candidatus Angelobacter sp.]|nr:hypothetical protein [Candidatus Angelobacter sp.]
GSGATTNVVTVLDAVLRRLQAIRPVKLAVFTPYVKDLTDSIGRCLNEAGFSSVKTAGMGIIANVEIGRVTPAEIIQFVKSQISGVDPDCIFLSCTNWRAIEAIPALQKQLGIPIISSNQAAIDIVLQGDQATRATGGKQ